MLFSKRRKRKTAAAAAAAAAAEATAVHYPPLGSHIHSSPQLATTPLPLPPPPYSAQHYSQSTGQLPLGSPPPPPPLPRRPSGIPAEPAVAVPAPLRPRQRAQHQSSSSVPQVYEQPVVGQRQWSSCLDLPSVAAPILGSQNTGGSSSSIHDRVADKFSEIISLIDEECFGGESELLITLAPAAAADSTAYQLPHKHGARGNQAQDHQAPLDRALLPTRLRPKAGGKPTNVFSKLDSYLNSRLPSSLPPLRVYLPTYPLLCLAAKYSASAYQSPSSAAERKDFVSGNSHTRAKAMVIKSVPIDDKKTIVFAIRGTSLLSLHDWGVNLATQPVSPAGFLDDGGNLCHAGFLRVARAMVEPIAARLRQLLRENPSRSACSLLLTGHSAGGAVAALLYAHMLSAAVVSELTALTGCFKRVHCVTFGAPPVSLLPLQKPAHSQARLRKCIFFSLINEGDPVVRAERAYVRSLIDLLACPDPHRHDQCHKCTYMNGPGGGGGGGNVKSRLDVKKSASGNAAAAAAACPHHHGRQRFWWDTPTATLSNAGRLIVLRRVSAARARKGRPTNTNANSNANDNGAASVVTASIVSDEQLRKVVFGQPMMHAMGLYQERVETLAVQAVTGRLLDQ